MNAKVSWTCAVGLPLWLRKLCRSRPYSAYV